MSEIMHSTYLDQSVLPYPFCPGCGHGTIIDKLNKAFIKLQLDPKKIVVVSDIGCNGLSDKFFETNAFHGLHGRSVTYATGIKLANPDLYVVVLMGDGGCGIGGHHLINAARRNIGITVIVFNNLNYGMTGGSHSISTPLGAKTATTRYGNLEQPMDICQTVAVNGANFVARSTSFDENLPDIIHDAIANEGFSLIDIWELCTAYFVPNNKFGKKELETTLKTLNFPTGVIQENNRQEYSKAYDCVVKRRNDQERPSLPSINPKYQSVLDAQKSFLVAGAAGKKIVSAARILSTGAVVSGLWATQRDDHPVTVKSGFSLSEVIISPTEVLFTGIEKPDIGVVVFPEGLSKIRSQIKAMTAKEVLYINKNLLPVETNARVIPLDFNELHQDRYWCVKALSEIVSHAGIYPFEAFREAVSILPKDLAAEYLEVINSGHHVISEEKI